MTRDVSSGHCSWRVRRLIGARDLEEAQRAVLDTTTRNVSSDHLKSWGAEAGCRGNLESEEEVGQDFVFGLELLVGQAGTSQNRTARHGARTAPMPNLDGVADFHVGLERGIGRGRGSRRAQNRTVSAWTT
eukprot:1339655-Rhodomonas_salina.4